LYIYENGDTTIVSARTRSWKDAETVAAAELAKRDPAKMLVQEIEDREAAKAADAAAEAAAKKATKITVAQALERWMSSHKNNKPGTTKVHLIFSRKVEAWAARQGITALSEITADMLDEWRSQWSPDAEFPSGKPRHKYDRMGSTTQSIFQSRLKGFFNYATKLGWCERDPSATLTFIKPSDKRTQPLTRQQFGQLLASVEPFTALQTGVTRERTGCFRALFLLQRAVGLRIEDCLVFPRSGLSGLRGNRLTLHTKKTGSLVERTLQPAVVEALEALSSDRPGFLPSFFFWPAGVEEESLVTVWTRYIRELSDYLSFRDAKGLPMRFHSHMLRDTYAVELLLEGMSLDKVSRLLTHKSIKITERYYADWVPERVQQLEGEADTMMARMGGTFSTPSPVR
jgi:site-specific recombinase XerD